MKPSIPKGTRDFTPVEMHRRKFIFSTIEKHFKSFGYLPIETPAMENLSTLTGKYGEEGDRLIFKILNSGDFLKKADHVALLQRNSNKLAPSIAGKALRYDLTVPFARFVVQHRNELHFPFKRYQIQPVWRADRPQKGRYREFYQCDADVIGSASLRYDTEMVHLMDEVLYDLGLKDFTIRINNRKILSGLAEIMNISDRFTEYTVAIDKLDKIGREGVLNELVKLEMPGEVLEKTKEIFSFGSADEAIGKLDEWFGNSETGKTGLSELRYVRNHVQHDELRIARFEFDVTLARGLDYYTGSIFEVISNEIKMGSLCGGGRYDDLTGVFGLQNMSGIGISFGADRLYDVLLALDRFPDFTGEGTELLFVNFGEAEGDFCEAMVTRCRRVGINAELYPVNAKMQKQMKYANAKKIPWVALIGENEIKSGNIRLKNMETGEQWDLSEAEMMDIVRR